MPPEMHAAELQQDLYESQRRWWRDKLSAACQQRANAQAAAVMLMLLGGVASGLAVGFLA